MEVPIADSAGCEAVVPIQLAPKFAFSREAKSVALRAHTHAQNGDSLLTCSQAALVLAIAWLCSGQIHLTEVEVRERTSAVDITMSSKTQAAAKVQPQTTTLGSVLSRFYEEYQSRTPQRLKLVDAYLAYVMLTGIVQFAYCCLVGTFPFNSFLSGFISCVGSFVLAGKWSWCQGCLYDKEAAYLVVLVCSLQCAFVFRLTLPTAISSRASLLKEHLGTSSLPISFYTLSL